MEWCINRCLGWCLGSSLDWAFASALGAMLLVGVLVTVLIDHTDMKVVFHSNLKDVGDKQTELESVLTEWVDHVNDLREELSVLRWHISKRTDLYMSRNWERVLKLKRRSLQRVVQKREEREKQLYDTIMSSDRINDMNIDSIGHAVAKFVKHTITHTRFSRVLQHNGHSKSFIIHHSLLPHCDNKSKAMALYNEVTERFQTQTLTPKVTGDQLRSLSCRIDIWKIG